MPRMENDVHSRHPGPVGDPTGARVAGDVRPDDATDWSWPPYAPLTAVGEPFDTDDWAPATSVWHPRLRVGRWTVLYRRAA